MRCPFCQSAENRVVDSRESHEGLVIRRRRACEACERRFTTYERVEELTPMIVKRDGRREPFDRDKLLRGLKAACSKRPVSVAQQEALAFGVERGLQESGEKEVASVRLGEEVMRRLMAIDEVAYVRFASVYRNFRDASQFIAELRALPNAEAPSQGSAEATSGDRTKSASDAASSAAAKGGDGEGPSGTAVPGGGGGGA